MVTIDKTIVERTIENNGILSDSDEITTHIVEYHEIFNRFPTWKLCKSEKEYKAWIGNKSFINPFLLWMRGTGE